MKTQLPKSKIYVALISLFVAFFSTNSNAQFNLGNFDPNSLNNLLTQIEQFNSQQDSILNEVQSVLNDSTIIDQDSLANLQNQLVLLSSQQDSLQKVLADSVGLTQDSINTLLSQFNDLSNQQDSLQKLITDANIVNIDSLTQIQNEILGFQSQFDSLSTIANKQLNNLNTLNQDTIDKYSSSFTELQKQFEQLINNQVQGVEVNNEIIIGLFPNPSNNFIRILSDEIIEKVSINSLNGTELLSFSNQENYNISSLQTGLYIVLVKTSKGFASIKLIKE
ncbi:MAG: hypothetical protein RLZZ175_852 [Bacteroidota bacterium]|jgi:hypothetical protein